MKKPFVICLLGLYVCLSACNGNNLNKKEEQKLDPSEAAAEGIDTTDESLDIDTVHNKHVIYDNP